MNQESRTLLAITVLVAALFVAMNRVAQSAPVADWWLALALLVIGVVLALSTHINLKYGRPVEEVAEEAAASAPALPRVHVYEVAAPAAAPLLVSASAATDESDSPLPVDADAAAAAASSADDMPLDDVNVDEPAPPPVDDDEAKG